MLAFHTPEFARYKGDWLEQADRIGARGEIVEMESTGDWGKNTALKPQAILKFMSKPDTPEWFLYTDIDAKVSSIHDVPATGWDIGIVKNPNPHHRNTIAAAALFVRNSPDALRFISAWFSCCELVGPPDHPRLTHTIQRNKTARVIHADKWLTWSQNGLSIEKPPYESR